MLSEDFIINCSDKIVGLFNSFTDYCIMQIAKELKNYYSIDEINRKASLLINAGALKSNIVKKIAKLNATTQKQVAELLEEAGVLTLKYDDTIYQKEGFEPIPLTASTQLQNILQAQISVTDGELKNLTRTTADKSQKEFINAVQNAELQVQTGMYSSDQAIENAIKTVVENGGGTKVSYRNGAYQNQLDVAVRRCVLNGVKMCANDLQMQRAKEMKAPYADTSAHKGARPTHQVWQGRRFSIFNDGKFPPFQPVFEQLHDYNCRHSWYPVMSADSPMARTTKDLNAINKSTVKSGGKKYTYYEAEQHLRQLERTVRKYKREKMALEEVGQDTSHQNMMIRKINNKIKTFCNDTGIKRRPANEKVYYSDNI